jgi:hypothetical protein
MVGIVFKSTFKFEAQFAILGMDLQTALTRPQDGHNHVENTAA